MSTVQDASQNAVPVHEDSPVVPHSNSDIPAISSDDSDARNADTDSSSFELPVFQQRKQRRKARRKAFHEDQSQENKLKPLSEKSQNSSTSGVTLPKKLLAASTQKDGATSQAAPRNICAPKPLVAAYSAPSKIYIGGVGSDNTCMDIKHHLESICVSSHTNVKDLSNKNGRKSFCATVPKQDVAVVLAKDKWPQDIIVRPFRDPKAKTERIKPSQGTTHRKSNRKASHRPWSSHRGIQRYTRDGEAKYRDDEPYNWTNDEYSNWTNDEYSNYIYNDGYSRQQHWQDYDLDHDTSYTRQYRRW